MNQAVSPLTLELLAWIARRPRTYAQAMDAWRSTCPRHSVWDDATIAGLIQIDRGSDQTKDESRVALTPLGQAMFDGAA